MSDSDRMNVDSSYSSVDFKVDLKLVARLHGAIPSQDQDEQGLSLDRIEVHTARIKKWLKRAGTELMKSSQADVEEWPIFLEIGSRLDKTDLSDADSRAPIIKILWFERERIGKEVDVILRNHVTKEKKRIVKFPSLEQFYKGFTSHLPEAGFDAPSQDLHRPIVVIARTVDVARKLHLLEPGDMPKVREFLRRYESKENHESLGGDLLALMSDIGGEINDMFEKSQKRETVLRELRSVQKTASKDLSVLEKSDVVILNSSIRVLANMYGDMVPTTKSLAKFLDRQDADLDYLRHILIENLPNCLEELEGVITPPTSAPRQ